MSVMRFSIYTFLAFFAGCVPFLSFDHQDEFVLGNSTIRIGYRGGVLDSHAWQVLVGDIERLVADGSIEVLYESMGDEEGRSDDRYILMRYPFGASYRLYGESHKDRVVFVVPENLAHAYLSAVRSHETGQYTESSLDDFVSRLNSYEDHLIRNEILPSQIDLFNEDELDSLIKSKFYLFDEYLTRGWWFEVNDHAQVPGVVIGYSEISGNKEINRSNLNVRIVVFIEGRWFLWR